MWRDQLLESFIRGIGKTTGALVLIGAVTGVALLINSKSSFGSQTFCSKSNFTQTEEEVESEGDHQQNTNDDDPNKFKKMFSRI